jgi:hypothetical protein
MQKRQATSCFSCLAVNPNKEGCLLGFKFTVEWVTVDGKETPTKQAPAEKCYKPVTQLTLKAALDKTK